MPRRIVGGYALITVVTPSELRPATCGALLRPNAKILGGVENMAKVYTCGKCRFCFERNGEVSACEDCGSMNIRLASDDEAAEYERNKSSIEN